MRAAETRQAGAAPGCAGGTGARCRWSERVPDRDACSRVAQRGAVDGILVDEERLRAHAEAEVERARGTEQPVVIERDAERRAAGRAVDALAGVAVAHLAAHARIADLAAEREALERLRAGVVAQLHVARRVLRPGVGAGVLVIAATPVRPADAECPRPRQLPLELRGV